MTVEELDAHVAMWAAAGWRLHSSNVVALHIWDETGLLWPHYFYVWERDLNP